MKSVIIVARDEKSIVKMGKRTWHETPSPVSMSWEICGTSGTTATTYWNQINQSMLWHISALDCERVSVQRVRIRLRGDCAQQSKGSISPRDWTKKENKWPDNIWPMGQKKESFLSLGGKLGVTAGLFCRFLVFGTTFECFVSRSLEYPISVHCESQKKREESPFLNEFCSYTCEEIVLFSKRKIPCREKISGHHHSCAKRNVETKKSWQRILVNFPGHGICIGY